VPVVTHLHGTEVFILEQIEQDDAADCDGSRIGSPVSRRHADYWAQWLRDTAQRSTRILAASTDHAARAVRILGISEDGVMVISTGVDTEHFRRLGLTASDRLALLRRWLVDDPHRRDESGHFEERAAEAQGLIHCSRLVCQHVAGLLESLTGNASVSAACRPMEALRGASRVRIPIRPCGREERRPITSGKDSHASWISTSVGHRSSLTLRFKPII